jgi:hypothetical protein
MEGNDHGIFEDTIPTFSGVSKENNGKARASRDLAMTK